MEQTRRMMLAGVVSAGAGMSALSLCQSGAGLRWPGRAADPAQQDALPDGMTGFTQWQARLGQRIALSADGRSCGARISEVCLSGEHGGNLAAASREARGGHRQPFSVRFELDSSSAPAGDTLFDLGAPLGSLRQLLTHPAKSKSGRATVIAFFG